MPVSPSHPEHWHSQPAAFEKSTSFALLIYPLSWLILAVNLTRLGKGKKKIIIVVVVLIKVF